MPEPCKICGAMLMFPGACPYCALRAGDMIQNPNSNAYKQRYEQNNGIIESAQHQYRQEIQSFTEENKGLKEQMEQSEAQLQKWQKSLLETNQEIQDQTQCLQIAQKNILNTKETNTNQNQQIKILKEQMRRTKQVNSSLAKDNEKLKNQVNALLDDKKEQETTIMNLEKELELFEFQSLDKSQFMGWDHKTILLWIQGIDGGYFNKYMEVLAIQLEERGLSGKDLPDLTTADIRGLGVKKFADAKKLAICVQKLMSGQRNNEDQHNAKPQKEGRFATHYM